MASSDNNTIQLQIGITSPYKEFYAAVTAVTPGMLLKRLSEFDARTHNNAGGDAERLFAVENPYQGGDIYTNYAVGDRMMCRICRPGDVVLAWVTNAVALPFGNFLQSNGDGTLTVSGTSNPEGIVAVLDEAYTDEPNPARVKVQIM
jgi:hypothetical protein